MLPKHSYLEPGGFSDLCRYESCKQSDHSTAPPPTPTVEEFSDQLRGVSVFSKIDLRCGYLQLELDVESCDKDFCDSHRLFSLQANQFSNEQCKQDFSENDRA